MTDEVKVWIDVDNPPQACYLLPFRDAFAARGAEIVVTARDNGDTFELLHEAGVPFLPVSASFGGSKWRKAAGTLARARDLARALRNGRRPRALLCASRSSALAARRLGVPSFVLGDYEHVHLALYRFTRSTMVFPDAIDPGVFRRSGLRADQLVPYRGLKEDITFAAVDVDAIPPHRFEGVDDELVKVLVRPPAESSHYHRAGSTQLTLALLERLASSPRAVVVFSPRFREQREYLERFQWAISPVVLEAPLPAVPLLKAADAVVCAGGTMLREAAYVGVPAYSIFRGKLGGVDRFLASAGRVTLVESAVDVRIEKAPARDPLPRNRELLDEIVDVILERSR